MADIKIKKPVLGDTPSIIKLINSHVEDGILIKRDIDEVATSIREFFIGVDNGKVIACASLKIYNMEIGEIRSLVVEEGYRGMGIGKNIVNNILNEAKALGLKTVFALTTSLGFFTKIGFYEVDKSKFPQKIWKDCLSCPYFPNCIERAVEIVL